MRLQHLSGESTAGLEAFTDQFEAVFPEYQALIPEIREIIVKSGCPEIRFDDNLGGVAAGISMTDQCVISLESIRDSNFQNAIFIILHEIAHQKQYSRHGEDFALGLYTNEMSDDDIVDGLLKIETAADKYALKAVKWLMAKHGKNLSSGKFPGYQNFNRTQILQYMQQIRQMVKNGNLTTIESINNMLYDFIKDQSAQRATRAQRYAAQDAEQEWYASQDWH
jgi:hypothetical protein